MSRETLRELIERMWEENVRFHAELDGESDRAAAIIAASYFEERLCEVIMTRFVKLDRKVQRAIFTGYGPLSTFKAKVDIAFALGLLGRETRRGLHTVGRVRNKFAHASKPLRFDHEDFAIMCRDLKTAATPDPDNLRGRYLTYLKEAENSIRNAVT